MGCIAMNFSVSGRKMPVTEALQAYAEEKIKDSVEQLGLEVISCDCVLYCEKNPANPTPATCEVTVTLKGQIARVEIRDIDMYAAIDIAAAKIVRQLRKYKTRMIDKRKRDTGEAVAIAANSGELDIEALMEELTEDDIVKRKEITYTVCTEEEALSRMDLLGHDFYIYTDRDTNEIHLLYRRHDGCYGKLTPKNA